MVSSAGSPAADDPYPTAPLSVLEALRGRRSYGRLLEPGPTKEQLTALLEAAVSAPDHDELRPWRFVVLAGQAQADFGDVLAEAYLARCAQRDEEPVPAKHDKERTKLGRAPMVIVTAVAYAASRKAPRNEQYAAVAAATSNLCVAAHALGFGSMWRTGDPAYDPSVKAALGLRPDDDVVGFVYLGTVPEGRAKPPREPELDSVVTHWTAAKA